MPPCLMAPLTDGWRESHDDDDGPLGAIHAPHCIFGYIVLVDAPRLGLSGLKLKGFQDTLRRPVALYPDLGKLCTYPD